MQDLPRIYKLWLWVNLDPFYAKVKFGHIGFCMGKSENYYFLETIAALGLNYEVEWMSKVKAILWPWLKVTQISKLKLVFVRNSWELNGEWEWKLIQMSRVTWPTWPPCPYMVKTLKNLLQNQQIDDLETWYVALSMRVLPRLYKLWPWIDLDLLYIKVKFGYIGFCMGESEFCFETIVALGLKVAWSIQLNELMKLNEYQRSTSFFELGQRSSRFQS